MRDMPFIESPWYFARRNLDQKGKALLTRLYGKVPGYDIEYEWQLIHNVLDEEKRQAEENGHVSFWEIFRGANFVRPAWLKVSVLRTGIDDLFGLYSPGEDDRLDDPVDFTTIYRSCFDLHILDM